MTKQTIVVGAGPGGLAAAMQLADQGYQVDLYEKQPQVGGRTSKLQLGDYAFDLGPTFFMMPQVLEEVFERVGRQLHDYVDLIELDPLYTLKFGDVSFTPSRDVEATAEQISQLFPGDEDGYRRFLNKEGAKFDRVINLLRQPFNSYTDFLTKDMALALPKLNALDTVYGRLSHYFQDERLKWAFSFQAKYLGMSAWNCPGTFTILSYIEHRYGLYHPVGGVNAVCEAMRDVILELGGRVHLETPVNQIIVNNGRATGVELADGRIQEADDVVINADFGYAVNHLFDPNDLTKYKPEKLQKKKLSCSTFMVYLGIDQELDLPHHMVLFAEDYKRNVEDMTERQVLSDDPSIYVHNPNKLDSTLAPEGKTALYLLMPVPNLTAGIDWEDEKQRLRDYMVQQIANETGLHDLEDLIEVEHIVTPSDWEETYHVYEGATFNLAHSLDQMMIFRPHNQFEDVDHCFLVGGGTHPGSGLPTIFQSAMISVDLLTSQPGYQSQKPSKGRVAHEY
ncbi:phytoene desaturase family protein [Alkalibacillus almallahensis]|uniref:phytoene desaturase family protein n=1 Tax=Alkalibacillus almallahensis TaxID=1379154 RepID=UPI00141E5EE0|nr:phytoene desaturase family protein [Alkalibacillus almallahensis]NIK11390.1 phytoene desaturase [Alkalibacillus almallahensis]